MSNPKASRHQLTIWVSDHAYQWIRETRGESTVNGRVEQIIEDAFQNAWNERALRKAAAELRHNPSHD